MQLIKCKCSNKKFVETHFYYVVKLVRALIMNTTGNVFKASTKLDIYSFSLEQGLEILAASPECSTPNCGAKYCQDRSTKTKALKILESRLHEFHARRVHQTGYS